MTSTKTEDPMLQILKTFKYLGINVIRLDFKTSMLGNIFMKNSKLYNLSAVTEQTRSA